MVTRFAGSAVLIVTSHDLELARRIVASAAVATDAPCPANSPVAGALGARPPAPTDLDALAPADSAVLCQYEPAFDPADRELPSLRAVVSLDREQARDLVDRLTAAPVNQTSCDPPPYEDRPDIALQVTITAGGSTHTVYVSAAGCPDDSGQRGRHRRRHHPAYAHPERLPGAAATADRAVLRQRGHREQLPGLTAAP